MVAGEAARTPRAAPRLRLLPSGACEFLLKKSSRSQKAVGNHRDATGGPAISPAKMAAGASGGPVTTPATKWGL